MIIMLCDGRLSAGDIRVYARCPVMTVQYIIDPINNSVNGEKLCQARILTQRLATIALT